ncbi:hypothetical protein [Azospirillum thermophilum]|uniref:Uncharacterized protein n=1 Tax=Azospirillum thermophilum TaxID=2202148 RepID=A0A2S2CX32_9PROT|nr:hypothetical protein [Azospirillum thermophilum]AWK89072.1 hypothetical protein DEW08_23965 [Azospirillum thermophilum]
MSRQRADLRTSSRFLRRTAVAGVASLLTAFVAVSALPAAAAAPAKSAPAKAAATKASASKSTGKASAKPQACYNRNEHAAEQALRMHTEMMVVGLTCRDVYPEEKPYDLYQNFTIKNRATLSSSEATMIDYFRKHGGNGTKQFDTYRTELANEVSRRAAVIGRGEYCMNMVSHSKVANELTPTELKTLTSDPANAGIMHLASKPLCDVKLVSTPDPAFDVAQATPPRSSAKATPAKGKPAKAPAKAPAKKVAAAPDSQTVAANIKR